MNHWISAISFAIAFFFGYVNANSEVSTECDRLGGFYVGSKIYKCVKVEKL